MQRVIEEMAKAKSDVEKRYREKLPQIIRECMAFAYLGKSFRFDANSELDNRVNQRLIELGDEILADIETRAKKAIKYAEEEDDEATILAYMKREQDGEDLITRIDKHNSNFRYFLEGWMAIGIVNGLSQTDILSNIFRYMHNVYVSDLWNDAFKQGYLSDAIRTRGYRFGKGILRNPIDALSEIEKHSINEAFQYGRFLKYQKDGAIGYTIHRNSYFDCPYCDSFTGIVHPMDVCLLPLHPRCVCYSMPVFKSKISLSEEQKRHRKELEKLARAKFKDKTIFNVFDIAITRNGIKEYLNQPHAKYFEKNEMILNLDEVLSSATYLGINESYMKDGVLASYIYETVVDKHKSWLIVRRHTDNSVSLHSISDNPEVAKNLKK